MPRFINIYNNVHHIWMTSIFLTDEIFKLINDIEHNTSFLVFWWKFQLLYIWNNSLKTFTSITRLVINTQEKEGCINYDGACVFFFVKVIWAFLFPTQLSIFESQSQKTSEVVNKLVALFTIVSPFLQTVLRQRNIQQNNINSNFRNSESMILLDGFLFKTKIVFHNVFGLI